MNASPPLQVDEARVFWNHPNGRFVDASEAACESLGYSREALCDLSIWDVVTELTPEGWLEHWDTLRRTRLLRFRATHRHRDGTRFEVDVCVHCAQLAGQAYACALVYPLAQSRRNRIAHQENAARLALALDVSGQALFELDLLTGQVAMSQESARLLERDPTCLEVPLASWREWIHPDDRDRIMGLYADCVAGKREDISADFRILSGSGRWIWLRSASRVFQWDSAKRPLRMLGTHLDITESKKIEERLRLTQTIIDRISIGVFWFDTLGRIIYVNDIGCRWLGYELGELIGETVEKFDASFDAQRAVEIAKQPQPNGVIVFETRHRRKDGTSYPVEITATFLDIGEQRYRLAFARDISGWKADKDALREHTRFLESLDRISRVLTRSERDTSLLAGLAYEIMDIFQADRAFFLHPCDPNGSIAPVIMEVARTLVPGTMAARREIEPDADFKRVMRQILTQTGAVLTEFDASTKSFRDYSIHSQMAIALLTGSDQPWILGLHQCDRRRSWTEREQWLFEKIAERVGEALSGYLLLKRLKDSEARYRVVFDNSLDAILVHDAKGTILAANQTALHAYGLTDARISRYTIADLSGPENSTDDLLERWEQIMAGQTARFEWMAKQASAVETFPVEVMLRSIQYGDERVILANTRDISERKRNETALRQSEERFAKAFHANPVAMIISTMNEGRIIDANDCWLRLVGAKREEVIGRTTIETQIWADEAFRQQMLDRLRETGSFQEVPLVIQTRRDEAREILWSAETITIKGESVLLSLVYDLTEQRRTERALRESEARLRTAIESIPFDFFIIGADGCYALQNSASRARWGRLIGTSPQETAHQDDARWETKSRTALSGAIVDEELQQRLDGESAYFHNVLAPIEDNGQISGLVELNMDVTERKKVEQELQRYREHLEELVAERTSALQQAMSQLTQAEKLAALGNLVAGVAHELNTPLGNARMAASTLSAHLDELATAFEAGTLRRGQLSGFLRNGQETVDLLERNTVRAADLIGHFKEIAVDQTSVRRRCFNLRRTIDEVLATMRPTLKKTSHRLEIEIPHELELDSYPGPLEQIIANLVENSLTHGLAGQTSGTMWIKARIPAPGQILLEYGDDGVGIPETSQAQIFDPFFTTRLGEGGSGLGLYIVHNLISGVLGGSIRLDSELGKGARFILTFPEKAPKHQPVEPPML
ncbi:PAS domain S-box protein [Thiorhodococcus fuscus]|uniref:histidine kinase n=1 Tax=Thiorhodococcus fuscus TaxID=527200 RepID=A0ABW4YB39_9GAMM